MRFLVFLIPAVRQAKDGKPANPDFAPDPKTMAAITKFSDELKQAGALRSADGLKPLTAGVRLTFYGDSEDEPDVTDSLAIDPKEVVGGYWMLEAQSKRQVIDWMKRCPAQVVFEIRQVAEMLDFPADVQAAARGA